MATVVGAALPLLAPQSFAQGHLERRVPHTKDADFLQKVLLQSVFLLVTGRSVWVRHGSADSENGSSGGGGEAKPDSSSPGAAAGSIGNGAGSGSSPMMDGSSAVAARGASAAGHGGSEAAAATGAAAAAADTAAAASAPQQAGINLPWFTADELEGLLGLRFTGSSWSLAHAPGSSAVANDSEDAATSAGGWAAAPFLLGRESADALHFALPVPVDLPGLQRLAGDRGLVQMEMRKLMSELRAPDLALAGHAVALAAWHELNAFCGRCGGATKPIEAGAKRQCTRDTRHRVYPRTDAVAIMMVESADGQHALLGRSRGHRPGMLTCLSGFIDQSESIEEAARREVMEEAGLRVGPVAIVGSQPWPIGRGGSCELMVGCVAQAIDGDLRVDPDEMEDVRWVPRETVARAVAASAAGDHIANYQGGDEPEPGIGFWLPPPYAIAHNLIREWADRKSSWFASRL